MVFSFSISLNSLGLMAEGGANPVVSALAVDSREVTQGALFAAEIYYDVKQDFWQETTQVLDGVGDFLSDQGNEIAASATDVGESVARTAYLKNLFALNLVQATQEAISNAD